MVMIVKQIGFVETVNLLMNYKKKLSFAENRSQYQEDRSPIKNQSIMERKSCKEPVPIGNILTQLIGENRSNPHKSDQEATHQTSSPSIDITELERIVNALSQQIKELKSRL
jgi:hypothetical protein